MNTQLTAEDKARIFFMYYGAECLFESDIEESKGEPNIEIINEGFLIEIFIEQGGKLMLYDLSDITDEDAIEVAKIAARPHNRHFDKSAIDYKFMHRNKPEQVTGIEIGVWANKRPSFVVRIERDGVFSGTHPDDPFRHRAAAYYTPNQFEICDYLRSKSYMLPYKGVNLFESDIAIRKTKTT